MFDGEAQVQGTADPQPVRIRSGEQGITTNGQPTVVRPYSSGAEYRAMVDLLSRPA